MDEARGGGAPHGVLLAVVAGVMVIGPFVLGEQVQAILGAIPELLSPGGLLLLPVALILLIRFLSSDRANALSEIFSAGSPNSINRLGGSPVGLALLLLLLVVLLHCRDSLFGGNDSGD